MGFDLANLDEISGAMFMGWGGSMPAIWTLIAALICVYAIWSGNRHEHESYKKLNK